MPGPGRACDPLSCLRVSLPCARPARRRAGIFLKQSPVPLPPPALSSSLVPLRPKTPICPGSLHTEPAAPSFLSLPVRVAFGRTAPHPCTESPPSGTPCTPVQTPSRTHSSYPGLVSVRGDSVWCPALRFPHPTCPQVLPLHPGLTAQRTAHRTSLLAAQCPTRACT